MSQPPTQQIVALFFLVPRDTTGEEFRDTLRHLATFVLVTHHELPVPCHGDELPDGQGDSRGGVVLPPVTQRVVAWTRVWTYFNAGVSAGGGKVPAWSVVELREPHGFFLEGGSAVKEKVVELRWNFYMCVFVCVCVCVCVCACVCFI